MGSPSTEVQNAGGVG